MPAMVVERPQTLAPIQAGRVLPADHPRLPGDRIGVVLLNLGTPDGTGYWPMRRYLWEFLSDRRVIDYPAWLWQPLLQLVILTKRPLTSGHAYATIWDKELDESPLKRITRAQAEKLAERLEARSPADRRRLGMRYGNPSTAAAWSGWWRRAAAGSC